MTGLFDLPNELLDMIVPYLSTKDLISFCSTCTFYEKCLRDKFFPPLTFIYDTRNNTLVYKNSCEGPTNTEADDTDTDQSGLFEGPSETEVDDTDEDQSDLSEGYPEAETDDTDGDQSDLSEGYPEVEAYDVNGDQSDLSEGYPEVEAYDVHEDQSDLSEGYPEVETYDADEDQSDLSEGYSETEADDTDEDQSHGEVSNRSADAGVRNTDKAESFPWYRTEHNYYADPQNKHWKAALRYADDIQLWMSLTSRDETPRLRDILGQCYKLKRLSLQIVYSTSVHVWEKFERDLRRLIGKLKPDKSDLQDVEIRLWISVRLPSVLDRVEWTFNMHRLYPKLQAELYNSLENQRLDPDPRTSWRYNGSWDFAGKKDIDLAYRSRWEKFEVRRLSTQPD